MANEIILHPPASEDMGALRAFDQRIIASKIREQLGEQPTVLTRHRKQLGTIPTRFPYVPPLWELRVGEFRVFYDVEEEQKLVNIRAIRRKQPHQRTEDIV